MAGGLPLCLQTQAKFQQRTFDALPPVVAPFVNMGTSLFLANSAAHAMITPGMRARGRRVDEAPSSHVGVSYPAGSSWRHSASRGVDVTIIPRTGLERAIGVIG